MQYLVHPAFTGKPENGGWSEDITGIWVAKFEPTDVSEAKDKSKIAIKAGVQSLTNMIINAQFQLAKNSTFGETEKINSHMAKNSEWGAVAYLAQSEYGTNNKQIQRNTNSSYTGGTTNKKTIYGSNGNQSTTYNAYGVYDMVGGAGEYVASYVNAEGSSNLTTNGGEAEGDLYGAESERGTSTAYKTVYINKGSSSSNYTEAQSFKGDAIWETSNRGSSSTGSWWGTWSGFPYSSDPFFERGGYTSIIGASSFYFCTNNGLSGSAYISFRPVLAF